MDGDGSIQVNHWKNKYLQFRMVIKLSYNYGNLAMLNCISKVIGGYVSVQKEFII
jgi:cytochrome c oxidase subunit 1